MRCRYIETLARHKPIFSSTTKKSVLSLLELKSLGFVEVSLVIHEHAR
jgi:hypothetical protein